MYVRECGYEIVPGQEEKAAGLCRQIAEALGERGVQARARTGGVGERPGRRVQVVEVYVTGACMSAAQRALECDENFRSAVCAWAAEFYPLVQAAAPAVVSQQRLAA